MLDNITWSEFFLAATLIIGIYYSIAALLLYSGEIIAFAKSGFRKPSPQPSTTSAPTASVMGEMRTDDLALIEERIGELGEQIIDDDEPESLEPAAGSQEAILRAEANELSGEAGSVVQLAIDCDSDLVETASLFNALLIRYPAIKNSPFRASVNQAITDAVNKRMSFRVTVEQVDQWWNE